MVCLCRLGITLDVHVQGVVGVLVFVLPRLFGMV